MTSPSAAPPVVRLRSPGDLAAAVPQLCGFVPAESLVVLSLRGPRARLGLTVRVDLPPAADEPVLAAQLAAHLHADGATAAAAVVHTDAPGPAPRAALVAALATALDGAGIALHDRLLVRDGRWWSYDCRSPRCCPPEGTPVTGSPALDAVAAAGALTGRAVLPSREALADTLRPSDDAAAAARLAAAREARRRQVVRHGRGAVARDALTLWHAAVRAAPADEPADDVAALLVVSLQDPAVRDTVLTWALEDDEPLLWLLLALARRCAPPHDADVCALVAWCAHVRGDGALANVALDRALRTDPRHGLSRLGREALDRQVQPAAVRALLREAQQVLRRDHPETAVPRQ